MQPRPPQAPATGWDRSPPVHGGYTRSRQIASATGTSGQLRTVDHLARYGGEEFIVLLPGASTELATMVLERLRSATPAGQTFSAGVATWDRNETSEELITRADRALYEAKDAGRDRIQVAGELAPTNVQPSTVSMAPEMT
jgi:predicted signal transduction protein with EAL and GGDEF domain